MSALLDLETLIVHGSPHAMGAAQGEHFRDRIQRFLDVRFAAVAQYCRDRGRDGADGILEVGRISMACFAEWDPEGYAEHLGIARGAAVDPLRLYTATNMTDVRDALLLGATPDDEGCSSAAIPGALTASGTPIGAQTWDLNPSDVEFVVAIQRRPLEGPRTWTVTCAGCLTLMGINELGVAVGTTNIKTYGSRAAGVGYLGLLHRAARAPTAGAAAELIADAPRVGAHTYWAVDAEQAISLEASPDAVVVRELSDTAFVQTNHCLEEEHVGIQAEPSSESSLTRHRVLSERLAEGGQTPDGLKAAFADRRFGIHSVNRYAEDDQGTATNAVFIAEPAARRAFACRGPADRGRWYTLNFEDTP